MSQVHRTTKYVLECCWFLPPNTKRRRKIFRFNQTRDSDSRLETRQIQNEQRTQNTNKELPHIMICFSTTKAFIMVRMDAAVVIVLTTLVSLCRAASNSSGSSTTRRTHLRRGSMRTMGGQATRNIFLIDAKQPEASPRVSDCLYSASTSEECSKKEGCVWCKEPLYGLCLTKELAKKMSFLPFLTCSNATTLAVVI